MADQKKFGADEEESHFADRVSRRSALRQLGAGGVGVAVTTYPLISSAQTLPGKKSSDMDEAMVADAIPVRLRVNGKSLSLQLDPRTTLLDCLRESALLTGTKKGCDHGQCGACTVHVNGRRVNSSLSF